eukprot:scaffold15210_cov157-Isochrysis_galbana.AAC.4
MERARRVEGAGHTKASPHNGLWVDSGCEAGTFGVKQGFWVEQGTQEGGRSWDLEKQKIVLDSRGTAGGAGLPNRAGAWERSSDWAEQGVARLNRSLRERSPEKTKGRGVRGAQAAAGRDGGATDRRNRGCTRTAYGAREQHPPAAPSPDADANAQ